METVPPFPQFRFIKLDDRKWYDDLYLRFDPYADLSFANLMIWLNQRNDLAFSQLNGNLILRCTAVYMHDQIMFNILGNSMIDETIDAIFAHQKTLGIKQELLGAPTFIFEQMKDPSRYITYEDHENFEYILDTELLSSLQGSSMRHIRRYVNIYENHVGAPVHITEFDFAQHSTIQYLNNHMRNWSKAFTTNDSGIQEKRVIERTFALAEELGYRNICLTVGDQLTAFILYQSKAYHDTIIANHLKNSYQYRNTSAVLMHHLAKKLITEGVKYINVEQDLGVPGLRDFKMKLRPVKILPKYNITPL